MVNIILGYIWHYLLIIWPYFTVIGFFSLVNISMFYLGRWAEHRKWRREIKNGNRLGELAQEQLRQRDDRNKELTRTLEDQIEKYRRLGLKHRRVIGLSQEILNVVVSENNEILRGERE